MAKQWTSREKELLLSLSTDEQLKAAFPEYNIGTLLRYQRKWRAGTKTSVMEREPRILIYDLETAPLLGYAWQPWKTNILKIKEQSYILCFSYRWVGESRVYNVDQMDFPVRFKANPADDKDVAKALWDLLNEADIAVAHNGDKFDDPKSVGAFMKHGFPPPAPYKRVDTRKTKGRFDAMTLNNICDVLGIGRKKQTGGLELWFDCMAGDVKARRKMSRYCDHDVRLLHEAYLQLRPYLRNHPNVATLAHIEDGCSTCGHKRLQRLSDKNAGSWYSATTYSYEMYRCKKCTSWNRLRRSDKDVVKPTYVRPV